MSSGASQYLRFLYIDFTHSPSYYVVPHLEAGQQRLDKGKIFKLGLIRSSAPQLRLRSETGHNLIQSLDIVSNLWTVVMPQEFAFPDAAADR